MKFTTLSLFPQFLDAFHNFSIIKRAIGKGIVEIEDVDIRSFSKDKWGRTDSPPVGGGAGLIQRAQPIVDAIRAVKTQNSHLIMFSPRGKTYTQEDARRLAKYSHIILLSGHYEGIDERVGKYVDEELSIGDYVLTGGEIPSLVVMDSVIRLLDGAITGESLGEESFDGGLLEYPQYAEPYDFEGDKVPNILYCGNHTAIEKWRRKKALALTRERRPDLFEKLELSKQDKKLLQEEDSGEVPEWEKRALEKGSRFIKK